MSALRMQFFTLGIVVLIGIWLNGRETANWFLYTPVVLMLFAGLTGICPGLILWKKLGFKQ